MSATGIEPVTPTMSTRLIARSAGVSIWHAAQLQGQQANETTDFLGEYWAACKRRQYAAKSFTGPAPSVARRALCVGT
jgi:hypothetical protein